MFCSIYFIFFLFLAFCQTYVGIKVLMNWFGWSVGRSLVRFDTVSIDLWPQACERDFIIKIYFMLLALVN